MGFNELNSVEHYIIRQLTGVNLNASGIVEEPAGVYGGLGWKYVPSEELKREITEVMVESELKRALIKINPEIAAQPDRAAGPGCPAL